MLLLLHDNFELPNFNMSCTLVKAQYRQEQELQEALRESEEQHRQEQELQEALREQEEQHRQEQELREALRESELQEALRESEEQHRQERKQQISGYVTSILSDEIITGIERNIRRDNLEEFYQILDEIMKTTRPGEEYFNQGAHNYFKNIESISGDQNNCCGFNAANKMMTILP